MTEFDMYKDGMSIPQISEKTGMPRSTLRLRFKSAGILRGRADGVRLAAKDGRLGKHMLGKKREFTDEWRENISKSRKGKGLGYSIKPGGYVEITMGDNKGRLQHVVIMEEHIGRRIAHNECVHHIDGNRQNNALENLQLMTKSEHAALHAKENYPNRDRDDKGRFL